MAGFWRPRRPAEAEPDEGDRDMTVAPDADLLGDPELAEQLAHLEAIEQRYAGGAEAAGAEPELPSVAVPDAVWPEAIPPLPDPASGDPNAVRRWLDTALAVLSARASRNRDELQRLSSQWVHISRNLTRFRADEVAAVVESQARVRERIAGDETACHLVRLLQGQFEERPEQALSAADVELLRTLLEDAAADRVASAQQVTAAVLEDLSGLALDLEVVQREVERDPGGAAERVRGLLDRLAGVVEDLRGRPGTELVAPREGEPLHTTLRRCLDAYQRLGGDLAWNGAEPADPEVAAAVLWIVQEFLAGMAAAGGRSLGVGLSSGGDAVVLQLSADVPPAAGEGGWVLRCRARAAVAGGTLAIEASDGGCVVSVRFPDGAAREATAP